MDTIREFKVFGSEESKYTLILIPGGPGLGPEYMVPFAQQLAKDHQVVLMRTGYSC